MGKRLRIGIVGAGNIAAVAQLPALASRDDVELAGVVTRRSDPEALLRRWPFQAAYPSIESMIAATKLDAIFVLTPRDAHYDAVKLALESGIDVFCEKPLASVARQAIELADIAEARGRILMVGLNRRFAPVYAHGREVFGASGSSFVVAQKNRAGSEFRATFENAIHMVDLVRWYCGGEPVVVTAHAAGDDLWKEDGVASLIRFDNGNTGVLVAARNAGKWDEKLDAYGSGASVNIEAPDRVWVTRDGSTSERELRSEAFGWSTATNSFGFAASVDHFLLCVRTRTEPLTSGREAAKTQILLDQVLEAAGLPLEENPDVEWVSHAQ